MGLRTSSERIAEFVLDEAAFSLSESTQKPCFEDWEKYYVVV